MELEGGLRVAWADGSSIAALTGVRVGLGQRTARVGNIAFIPECPVLC